MENLEFKGTSGEWKCYRKTTKHKIEQVRVGAEIICHVPIFMNEHSEANAKLIASAPELLELLRLFLKEFEYDNATEYECELFYKAKQVIEKSLK